MWYFVQQLLSSLWQMRLKALIAIIGLSIGMASLFMIQILTASEQQAQATFIENMGVDLLSSRISPSLNASQMATLASLAVEHHFEYRTYQQIPMNIYHQGQHIQAALIAIDEDVLTWLKLKVVPKSKSVDSLPSFCLIGEGIQSQFKENDLPQITLGHRIYSVDGVMSKNSHTAPLFDYDIHLSIFVSMSDLKYFSQSLGNESFLIKLKNDKTSTQNKRVLEQDRIKRIQHIYALLEQNFGKNHFVYTKDAFSLAKNLQDETAHLVSLFSWVAGIALFLGILSATNLFLVGIIQRYPEIGLRLSLGATTLDIIYLFLGECILLNFIAALLGMMMGGVALPFIMDNLSTELVFSISAFLYPCLMSVVTGIICGLYPAWVAVSHQPAQLMRMAS